MGEKTEGTDCKSAPAETTKLDQAKLETSLSGDGDGDDKKSRKVK